MVHLLERYYGRRPLRPARDPDGFSTRLSAYFEGELTAIDGLPVGGGGTAFQARGLGGLAPDTAW